jgi:peptidoglycan biosynthesis protein MviN/MurJ (putative lipid II flippase)
MRLGMIALAVNLGFNLTTVWFLGGIGLVLGMILGALVQLWLTIRTIQQRLGTLDWPSLRTCLAKTLVATGCMVGACLLLLRVLPAEGSLTARAASLLANVGAGLAVYFAVALLLRIDEVIDLLKTFGSGGSAEE